MAQRGEIDRHRLGPAEQDAAQPQGQQREQYSADRIDMAQRIQADAPLLIGGHIAKMPRHIAMRRFVQGDGEQHGYRREGDGLYQLVNLHQESINSFYGRIAASRARSFLRLSM